MKNFKLKSVIYGFMSLLFIATIFSSCSKEEIQIKEEQVLENNVQTEIPAEALRLPVMIPEAIADKGQEFVDEYLEKASKEEINQLNQDYVIAEFLKENDLINEFSQDKIGEQAFSDLDLSEVLTVDQSRTLKHKLAKAKEEFTRDYCYWVCYDVYVQGWCFSHLECYPDGTCIAVYVRCWIYSHTVCIWVCVADPVPTSDEEPIKEEP